MRRTILLIVVIFLSVGCSGERAFDLTVFPSFTTIDLNGNEVTDSIFADRKITAINIWMTNSPPCITLLPKLWTLNEEIDEVQIIGLIVDVRDKNDEKFDVAREITSEAPDDFLNLIANSDFNDLFMTITLAPATVFVDRQGNIIGQPVIGDDINLIRRELIRLLEINSPKYSDLQFIQDNIFQK